MEVGAPPVCSIAGGVAVVPSLEGNVAVCVAVCVAVKFGCKVDAVEGLDKSGSVTIGAVDVVVGSGGAVA